MTSSVTNPLKTFALIALALALGVRGITFAGTATEPGGAVVALLLMIGAIMLGIRAVRKRLPAWAARTTLAVGILVAAFATYLTYDVAAPLFALPQGVPSAVDSAPSPRYEAAIDRAQELARAAVLAQNLPGVSVAVGADGDVVWAEGFGWRDVVTQAPVTPDTRFVTGTAAGAVTAAAVAPLGLTGTGAESAAEWSPEHTGEPEEDPPPFTLIRLLIFRPIGLAPAQPLPGDRATFYVPRTDDRDPRLGRRLMYMRDLACCADGMASYSTPSDLVRVALATNAGDVTGELAGGSVMSLVTRGGIVVAVTSNVAYADTGALALGVADAFAGQ